MRRQLFLATVGAIALTGSAFAANLAPPPSLCLLLPIHGQASMPASRSVTPGQRSHRYVFYAPAAGPIPGIAFIPGATVDLNDSVGHNSQGVIAAPMPVISCNSPSGHGFRRQGSSSASKVRSTEPASTTPYSIPSAN